jgi:GNAT superfamily N-acetyltransferase
VLIEDFTPADQAAVRDLVLAGLGEHWGVADPTRTPDLDDIAASYGHGRTVVARLAGRVVGTGTVLPHGDDALVVRMSVSSDLRRSGVGGAVLDELVATARTWGAQRVVLETTSAWTGVIEFYLRAGFRVTHTASGESGCDTWFALDL